MKLQAVSTATTTVKDLTKSIISSCSWVDNGNVRKTDQVSSDHHERSETSKVYYSWGNNCRKNVVEAEPWNNESDSTPKLLTSSWNNFTSNGTSSRNQIKLMSPSSHTGNVKTRSVLPRSISE